MKTKGLLKTIFAGLLIFLALSLVTCDLDLPGITPNSEKVEYTDVVISDGPNGTRSITLYLSPEGVAEDAKPGPETYGVPLTQQQRALNLAMAKRSHDYFEAVFISPGIVARAAWEIGQAAGIRGVHRGVNYAATDFSTATDAAVIFVGRKIGGGAEGTLLGVGYLSHIDGMAITGVANLPPGTPPFTVANGIVGTDTKSVTFTVSALETKVGFDFGADSLVTGAAGLAGRDSFLSAAGAATFPDKIDPDNINAGNSMAGLATFKNDATYTMFGLPEYNEAAAGNSSHPVNSTKTPVPQVNAVWANYTIGGLALTTTQLAENGNGNEGYYSATTGLNLANAVLHYPAGTGIDNFQVIERVAIYRTLGQTHDVTEADLDPVTTVHVNSSYSAADDTPFVSVIPLVFEIHKRSGGAFAFTFQTPVYALAKATTGGPALSTNGGLDAIQWYIKPGHAQDQFILDNGQTSGGAVLMGVGVGSLDWLEIRVWGFGFTN